MPLKEEAFHAQQAHMQHSNKKTALTLLLAGTLIACGQGGRADFTPSSQRHAQAPSPASAAPQEPTDSPHRPALLGDLVGPALEALGLGFRVETWMDTPGGIVHQTAYGVEGFPVTVDVDANPATGAVGGAEISVQFSSALLSARLQIDRLAATSTDLPVRVEVTVLDPRNLLGLPGTLGLIDPDLRLAMGMDAVSSDAPTQFVANLQILDSLLAFLPRFTSLQYAVNTQGGAESIGATLTTFADRAGQRQDTTEIAARWTPVVSEALIDVVMAPDAQQSSVMLSVAEPSAMTVNLRSVDGLADEPMGYRNVGLSLAALQQSFNALLTGVDGFDGLDDRETRYELSADAPLERLVFTLEDSDVSGAQYARAELRDLPTSLDVVQTATNELRITADAPVGSLSFGQSRETPVVWTAGTDPDQPFREHAVHLSRHADGRKTTLVRLAGLQSLNAQPGEDFMLEGQLLSAPLQYREDDEEGFVDARIDQLPAEFSVTFPDESDVLRFGYSASNASPGLRYEKRDARQTIVGDIRPLPQSFSLCASSDDHCGSHGNRTVASVLFEASEAIRLNYAQRSRDGREELTIRELNLTFLALDAGLSSSGSKGYLYMDTAGENFYGSILQRDGDSGMSLQFSDGTHAEQRRIRFKNYVQIDQRSGTMQCPGRESLDVRAGGRWYDFDFVLDALCQ